MSNIELDALTQRVENLEKLIAEQVTPRFDDVQDDHRSLSARINDYQCRVQADLSAAIADLQNKLAEELSDLRKKFNDRVQQEISKVTAEEIATSLSRKVLVTRPATRGELNDADVLKVRQATAAELRQQ